jgi:small subunit ribosomal protein S8
VRDIRPVLGGLGISILSTSQGILSDADARKMNIGGELICTVY